MSGAATVVLTNGGSRKVIVRECGCVEVDPPRRDRINGFALDMCDEHWSAIVEPMARAIADELAKDFAATGGAS